MESNKRILKLDETEFVINEEQMIATSDFLKRMLIGGIHLSFFFSLKLFLNFYNFN